MITGAVTSFICGLLNILNLYLSAWVLLDIFAFIGLGFGILLGRSRVCAIIACIYFLIGKIYVLLYVTNTITIIASVLFLGLLVLGIVGTFRFHNEYNNRGAILNQRYGSNQPTQD